MLHVHSRSLMRQYRASRPDPKPLEIGEMRDDVIGHPKAEISLRVRIVDDVKGQDCEGQGRRRRRLTRRTPREEKVAGGEHEEGRGQGDQPRADGETQSAPGQRPNRPRRPRPRPLPARSWRPRCRGGADLCPSECSGGRGSGRRQVWSGAARPSPARAPGRRRGYRRSSGRRRQDGPSAPRREGARKTRRRFACPATAPEHLQAHVAGGAQRDSCSGRPFGHGGDSPGSDSAGSPPNAFARPKSSTFTRPSV